MSALGYLLEKEYSDGHGQCPECEGLDPNEYGDGGWITPKEHGHSRKCKLASAIKAAGGQCVMQGEFKPKALYEYYVAEDGIIGTRPKTKDGCPVLKQQERELNARLLEIIQASKDQIIEALTRRP